MQNTEIITHRQEGMRGHEKRDFELYTEPGAFLAGI